ncbi:AraC family transcriptional regulator [Streptomyces sp. NRRL S-337]|uniref:AraC family transcriptional regulator n=1 Tax=Streptomyces sp. NRRL S-337 TaxID=1463900 RepID=UPI00099CFB4A|nr:AraC family transcriptional regulator [Streptomyces sp. NRRL S-337]
MSPPLSPPPAPAATRTALGFLQVSTVRGAAQPFVCEPGGAPADPHLVLGLLSSGTATLLRGETAERFRSGDLFVRDAAEPFALHPSESFELHLVWIPRRALALTDSQARALGHRAPFAGGAVAPLLVPLLRELVGAVSGYSPRTALHLAGSVAELVTLLAVEGVDSGPRDCGQDRQDLVGQIRSHVDARLWDRELTPATVAAAQHISIRYLHKLFESHGSTIGRWIQHRRLEEARRELGRPGTNETTVAAVARRWGFASATHFSRSFRAAYGVPPSDWRDDRTRLPGAPRNADG